MPSLFVYQGQDQGALFELEEGTLGVGRDKANHIQIHDTEVSRRHAEIRFDGVACFVADLSSSNGTYLNGERIEQQQQLSSGDRLQIGGTMLLFTDPGDNASEDLSDKIDIVHPGPVSESSRIVRAMSQREGSELLNFDFDGAASPWLARARSNLQVMYRTALAVSHTLDIDQLLNRIMQLIFEWVEADRGCIMLLDEQSKTLAPKVRRNRQGHSSAEKLAISKTILDYVVGHNEGVLTSDAREDERWDQTASIVQMGIREAICVPMQGRYDVVGVIYIDTSTTPQRVIQQRGHQNKFTDEHLKLMIAIAHQAALAVEDTRYYTSMMQAERLAAVGQTIAMLSHHIKNILQGIRGGSYLIEMGLSAHDENVVRKGWNMVERNQGKISALVMDMLTFSKEREPDPVPGDLNQIVGEVVELVHVRADELKVALQWHPAEDIPILTFDPEGIHRAVLNVSTNAVDACEEKPDGKVIISTQYYPTESLVRIVVEDNGSGIDPEDLDKIFTLFVSRKGGRGTGLGLPVSQKILKEHGGNIHVTSQLGQGSRFTIELPALVPSASIQETGAGQTLKS
ncbi:MAG: FHA domain-containing protein [Planctomycetia bacterium]|nr:FHA domain-containing protein [Planctomycetia bacterium]